MHLHPKIKAVLIGAALAVLASVGADVANLGLDPAINGLIVAAIAVASGYLKSA